MSTTSMSQPLYVAKAELFRSLGHPGRIRILELLAEGDQPVALLQDEVGLESSALSQQLAVLKRTGLVESRRKGNTVTYRLTDPSVVVFLSAARAVLGATLDRTRQALEHLESVSSS